MTEPNMPTVRGLLEELAEEVRRARGTATDLSLSIFGPRPADESNAKDPRSDMRSLVERMLAGIRDLNGELTRINNGIGVPQKPQLMEKTFVEAGQTMGRAY